MKAGLAFETFRNLSITVAGFVAYARSMISCSARAKPDLYIPVLHSNQSTIESLFSLMRSMNFDRVQNFSKGLGATDFRHSARAVEKSKTYEAENLSDEIHDSADIMEQMVCRSDTRRNAQVEAWASDCKKLSIPDGDIEQFPTDYEPTTPIGRRAFTIMKSSVLRKHFASILVESEDFQKWMYLSVSTTHEKTFVKLTRLSSNELVQFDRACQNLQSEIFNAMELSISSPKNSIESSFERKLLRIQRDGTLQRIIADDFPSTIGSNRIFGCCIFHFLAGVMYSNFIHAMQEHAILLKSGVKSAATKHVTVDEENTEVNRKFGWAISQLKRHYERKKVRKTKDISCTSKPPLLLDEDTAVDRVAYLLNMRVLHHEAITDDCYVQLHYDASTRILNDGGLTLVSKIYFPFGYKLLRCIRESFSENDLKKNGNNTVKVAYAKLTSDESLWSSFASCDSASNCELDDESKRTIFDELVRKSFHARINEVLKKYKDANFGRHSKKGDTGSTFRGFLRARTGKKKSTKRGKHQKSEAMSIAHE